MSSVEIFSSKGVWALPQYGHCEMLCEKFGVSAIEAVMLAAATWQHTKASAWGVDSYATQCVQSVAYSFVEFYRNKM